METLRIAAVQPDILWEKPDENLGRMEKLLNELQDVDMILFPETFLSGYTMNSRRLAEPRGARAETFLKKLAEAKKAAVGGGWIQENGEKAPLNTFSFFFPNGEVKHYLKNHPFSFVGEEKFYTAGEELCCFDYKGFSLSLLICYDLRFPEIFRRSAGQTDLYLLIANWPDERIEHWDTLLKARAIENQAFVLGVNRVGNTGKRNVKNFPGHTSLYDPFGKNLIQDTGREEIFIVEISKETLQFYRNKFPFLKDRKPVHNPW